MASILKASSLATFKNKLDLPEGSLLVADNVVIDKDNIIMPRRGFSVYGSATPCCAQIKTLITYKDRILRHHGTKLQFDCCCNNGTFSTFSGCYTEPETGLRLKRVQANRNLYFTTTDGIKKISGTLVCGATNFTTAANFIVNAGGPKALDVTGTLSFSCGAFFTALSKTAYRMVWGYRDANNNLILGAPSSRLVVTNTSCSQANVCLTASVPSDVVSTCYFYQIYRSEISSVCCIACICCASPSEEMNLVIEKFVTQAEITAGTLTVQDTVPDSFRVSGTLLYTNPTSGEGILQANDKPPIAKDIAYFRNSVFFANTSTIQRKQFNMLSVSGLTSGNSKVIIGNCTGFTEYTFVGAKEVTKMFVTRDNTDGLEGDYVLFNSASNERKYFFYGKKDACTVEPCACDTSGRIAVAVCYTTCGTPSQIACEFATAINSQFDFTATAGNSTHVVPCSSVSAACDTFTLACHGLSGGEIGQWTSSAALPCGICACTDYYVVCVVGCTFKVSTAFGGCAVDITGAGTGCHTFTTRFVTVTNAKNGNTTNATNGATSPVFTFCVTTQGDGEAANTATGGDVLLSSLTSAGQSIDETAKSLVNIINRDTNGLVNAYYLSGEADLPGIILLESRSLQDCNFYVGSLDSCACISCQFNPALPKSQAVTSFAAACCCTKTLVTMGAAHGFSNCCCVFIYNTTNCTCGNYKISSVVCCACCCTFTFKVTGTLTETCARVFKSLVVSDNEVIPNRLYFSKTNQPEAVPLTNFRDIGSQDSKIERILALRDNLIVLKEDGVYIVSGCAAPNFTDELLDCSAIILAPDSARILNNQIFALTTQGIVAITDGGVGVVSRNIEDKILEVTNDQFCFRTSSFGVSSESDRAYHIWLPTTACDTTATQAFRYNAFNQSWVRWTIAAQGGVVNPRDDKIYLIKTGKIHKERKNDNRTDYADEEFSLCIPSQCVVACSKIITVSSTTNFTVGDVLTQTQFVTTSKFNRLLTKLDSDVCLGCSDYSCLSISSGACLDCAISTLITKVDADDPCTCYSSPVGGSFAQNRTDFNTLVCELNSSSGTSYSSYQSIGACCCTVFEGIVTEICATNSKVTMNECLPWVAGPITRFEGINSCVQWAPQHFGDPQITKQISEGTIDFDDNNFYSAKVAYSTDLSRNFDEKTFFGRGTGIFGTCCFGCQTWGGCGTQVPLRTLIPKDKQRCRYIFLKFNHFNAREDFKIIGIGMMPRQMNKSRGWKKI